MFDILKGEIKMNNNKVSYMRYSDICGRRTNPVTRERVDYKNYESRRHQLAKKLKVNPVAEAILGIEDLLMETEVSWSISYEPSTKSYTVFIANLSEEEPKPKEDLNEEPVFDTEFMLDSGYDCQDLIRYLNDIEKRFNLVTVADLYEYVGEDVPNKAHKYGWLKNDIDKADFTQLPFEGYMLKIAKPKPIV